MTTKCFVFEKPPKYHVKISCPMTVIGILFCFDPTKEGEKPRIERLPHGRALVRAYTDLKRHQICDANLPHFCNERLIQGGVPTDQFISRKL